MIDWQTWMQHSKLQILITMSKALCQTETENTFPLTLAKISARLFEIMPKPLLTIDQLRLLKYDNVLSGKYKSNSEIGIPSRKYFDTEVKKYCFMWKDGGQFSTEKYTSPKDLKN